MATGGGGAAETEISDGLLKTFQEGRVFGPPDFGGQSPDQKDQTKEQPKVRHDLAGSFLGRRGRTCRARLHGKKG